MSIQSEIDRINSNVQAALNAVADTGVSVPEGANSDNLPAAVSALANEKQDKLTGAQGQIVGFGPDGKAVAQDKPTYAASEVGAIPTTEKGAANGVATLGADGKVPSAQLPSLDYVPTSEKGAANGVATLGADRKIPAEQLPTMDYAAKTHASQHASDGADPITPDAIGAAAVTHSHAAGDVTSGTFAAARIPSLAASKITAGTFAATDVKAMNGTDYTTARVRNIQASTTDLTAGSSALANGDIYLVYE